MKTCEGKFPKHRQITLLRRVADEADLFEQRHEEWKCFAEMPPPPHKCMSSVPTGRVFKRTRKVPVEVPFEMREGEILALLEPSLTEIHVFAQVAGDPICGGVLFSETPTDNLLMLDVGR